MDLNQLLYQHQVALIRAADSPGTGRAGPTSDLVRHYANRITAYRERRDLFVY
jgi:hypothetical protein